MQELAGCVIPNDRGDILLIHRNTLELVQWELPGGKVKPGETPVLAAGREIYEELGLIMTGLREIGHTIFTDRGKQYYYTWFLPNQVQGEPQVRESMHDECGYFPLESVKGKRGFSTNVRKLAKFALDLKAVAA